MNRSVPTRIRLDTAQFGPREVWLLRSTLYSISLFRFGSGVEAARIACDRGELIWLPFLGQQLWDWKIDGKSRKFTGFVESPAFGRNFLQNYGAFLVHCGMSAMGNPGPDDTHPQHGEMPCARFDRAWIELSARDGEQGLALCGSLHWHVPYQCHYRCVLRTIVDPSGTSVRVEIAVENESGAPMELMYLGHLNFALMGDAMIRGMGELADGSIRIRDPHVAAGARERLRVGAFYPSRVLADPEFVATIDHCTALSDEIQSQLVLADGSSFWVRHGKTPLDHQVVWITNTPDRGACGFHLPSTGGPEGLAAARAAGEVKIIQPRETARISYSFGYKDAEQK